MILTLYIVSSGMSDSLCDLQGPSTVARQAAEVQLSGEVQVVPGNLNKHHYARGFRLRRILKRGESVSLYHSRRDG